MDAFQNNALFQSPHVISEHAPHPANWLHGHQPEEGDQNDETLIQSLAGFQRTKQKKWRFVPLDDGAQLPQLLLQQLLSLPRGIGHADAEVGGTSADQCAVQDGDLAVGLKSLYVADAAAEQQVPSRDPRGSCEEPVSGFEVAYVDGLQSDLELVQLIHQLH